MISVRVGLKGGRASGTVAPGLSQNRNTTNRSYSDICFSKITKSLFVFLITVRNEKKITVMI
jgi:hypothetical protein